MNGYQRLALKKLREAEEFVERSLELAERFSHMPEGEERFLLQAIKKEAEIADFKAGRRDWP